MATSETLSFDDPACYQAAIRGAQIEIYPTAAGKFRAELTKVTFPRLWMQRAYERLPRVYLGKVQSGRCSIGFFTTNNQRPVHNSGVEVSVAEIIVSGGSDQMHRRTEEPHCWGAMSLTHEDLAKFGNDLIGHELSAPTVTYVARPSSMLMERLLTLHEQAGQLAKTAPKRLTQPQLARALEQQLIHVMVRCLGDSTRKESSGGDRHHSKIIARLEEFLGANHDRAVYLTEICAAIAVSERTLRVCCEEHLGMGPIRYLWLRRIYLAHHALVLAEPEETTVTNIATEYGFLELGRFSVDYKAVFGRPPSVTLRSPRPVGWQMSKLRPFALPASEFA
jgi:AraC-like DNA-binding protein